MSILAPIVRLARRLRLARAESDLSFLEARAPEEIARQRLRVAQLRILVQADQPPIDMITITRRIELAQKRDLLS